MQQTQHSYGAVRQTQARSTHAEQRKKQGGTGRGPREVVPDRNEYPGPFAFQLAKAWLRKRQPVLYLVAGVSEVTPKCFFFSLLCSLTVSGCRRKVCYPRALSTQPQSSQNQSQNQSSRPARNPQGNGYQRLPQVPGSRYGITCPALFATRWEGPFQRRSAVVSTLGCCTLIYL